MAIPDIAPRRLNGLLKDSPSFATRADLVEAAKAARDGTKVLLGELEHRVQGQMQEFAKSLGREPGVIAAVARQVADVLPSEAKELARGLEGRVGSLEGEIRGLRKELREALALAASMREMAEAVKVLSERPPAELKLPEQAPPVINLQLPEQPAPIVNVQTPPARLTQKIIEYDEMDRPWKTTESEIKKDE